MKRASNLVVSSPRSLTGMHYRSLSFVSRWRKIAYTKKTAFFEITFKGNTLSGPYLGAVTTDCASVLFVDMDRGKSVTNAIEGLVTSAVNTFGFDVHGTCWLETYGLRSPDRTIDRVYFQKSERHPAWGIKVSGPQWGPGYASKPRGVYLPLALLHEGLSAIFDEGGEICLPKRV